jgi:O-antigen ligase
LDFNFKGLSFYLASATIPSILLPIDYSSVIIILMVMIVLIRFYKKELNLSNKNKKFLLPFLIYFLAIFISFVLDLYYGYLNFEIFLKNIAVIIIPIFIFSSNFALKTMLKILKTSFIIVSVMGLLMIVIWAYGYAVNISQNDLINDAWEKSDNISLVNIPRSSLKLKISNSSEDIASLRRIIPLPKDKKIDSITRELDFKINSKENEAGFWALIRPIDDNLQRGVWVNMKTDEIGKSNGVKAKITKLSSGFSRIVVKNKVSETQTKEWFYISFVDGDGEYRLNNDSSNFEIYLKEPKAYLNRGKSLLEKQNLLKYNIKEFSFLDNYAHSTYMGLVFVFAIIFILFNPDLFNRYIRILLILINGFIIYALASKAIILGVLLIFPFFFYKRISGYKIFALISALLILLILGGGHIKNRFVDMYETLTNIESIEGSEKFEELSKLSTKQRYDIYSNYLELVQDNYLSGYGIIKGKKIVKSKFNHDFNAHNQFLQSIYNTGIIGFIFLLIFSFSPLIIFKTNFIDNYGIMFFILIILFNFLFESILYRQWGLILMSFSLSVYYQINKYKWFQ